MENDSGVTVMVKRNSVQLVLFTNFTFYLFF